MLVIPNKYCEELRALPDNKLNALEATFKVFDIQQTVGNRRRCKMAELTSNYDGY